MSLKWLAFIVTIWVLGMILGGVMESSWVGANETSILDRISNPSFSFSYLQAVWGMITLNFAFFDGVWQLARWIIMAPVVVVAVAMIVSFMRNLLPFGG